MLRIFFKRVFISAALIVGSILPSTALAYTSPGTPNGYVNDFAQVLTVEERSILERAVMDYEVLTTNELAIVTIPTTGDETIETYASELFEDWGIGKKGKDNGVLLLLAIQDRKLRIEVGYGLESSLTDAKSAALIRAATPLLKEENYYAAIYQLTAGIQSTLDGRAGEDVVSESAFAQKLGDLNQDYPGLFSFGFVLLFILLLSLARFVLGSILSLVGYLFSWPIYLLFGGERPTLKKAFQGMTRGRGGIFRSGGGGFGGGRMGGGFGGGRSGGGGSSGGW